MLNEKHYGRMAIYRLRGLVVTKVSLHVILRRINMDDKLFKKMNAAGEKSNEEAARKFEKASKADKVGMSTAAILGVGDFIKSELKEEEPNLDHILVFTKNIQSAALDLARAFNVDPFTLIMTIAKTKQSLEELMNDED